MLTLVLSILPPATGQQEQGLQKTERKETYLNYL